MIKVFPSSLFSCFFIPFSIVIASLGEEGAGLCAFHVFVRVVRVSYFFPFSLPLGFGGWLRLVIVALPGLFYQLFFSLNTLVKLQKDIDRLGSWARKWGMRFQSVKCNMMQLTRKRIKKIHASYTLEGTDLENVESIKYLGVTITSDLRWNTHVSNVCTKANRTLGFLRRNLYSCPQEVKEAAYKGLVRPVLDYGSSVWDPPGVVLQEELESVQKRAARFVTGNCNYETGSMTGILGQLKWESLKKRRKDNRLILLYKGLKGKANVPTDDLIPKTRRCRNQHSMAFQTPIANTDVFKGSFFPQTIRDWNALPDSLISSAEDAEDCVAKFTSLVRARD